MVDRVRHFRAQYQNISIVDDIGRQKYRVSGTEDDIYKVDVRKPNCTCPDWQKREPDGGCKHVIMVKIRRGEIEKLSYPGTNKGRSPDPYPDNWESLSRKRIEKDEFTCQKCGERGGQFGTANLHAHHIKPKSQGGADVLANLITVCDSCHEKIHGHSIPNTPGSVVSRYDSNFPNSDPGSKDSTDDSLNAESEGNTTSQPDEDPCDYQFAQSHQTPTFSDQMRVIPPWSQSHPENKRKQSVEQSSGSTISKKDIVKNSDDETETDVSALRRELEKDPNEPTEHQTPTSKNKDPEEATQSGNNRDDTTSTISERIRSVVSSPLEKLK